MAAKIVNILVKDDNYFIVYASGRTLTCSSLPKTAEKWLQEHDREADKTFQVEYLDEKEPDAFMTIDACDLETARSTAIAYLKGMTVLEVFEIDPKTYNPIIYESEEDAREKEEIHPIGLAEETEEASRAAYIFEDSDDSRSGYALIRVAEDGERHTIPTGGLDYDRIEGIGTALAKSNGVRFINTATKPAEIERVSALEEAERAWMEATDEDDMQKAVFQLQCLEPVAEETSLVPVGIPSGSGKAMEDVLQEAEEELGNLEYIGNVRKSSEKYGNPEEFGNSERLTAFKELATETIEAIWTGAKEAGRAIARTAPVVARTLADGAKVAAPVIASAALTAVRILASLAYRFGLVLMDMWYWLTTYIPIGARRARFWLVWDVAPEARRAARAAARFSLDVISMAGGWALACVLWALGTTVTVAKGLAYGWSVRESILAEDRAAA